MFRRVVTLLTTIAARRDPRRHLAGDSSRSNPTSGPDECDQLALASFGSLYMQGSARCAAKYCVGVYWHNQEKTLVTLNAIPGLEIACDEAVALVGFRRPLPPHGSFGSFIPLEFHKTLSWIDDRMRIVISIPSQRAQFYLLFDTGSPFTVLRLQTQGTAGYIDTGLGHPSIRQLNFSDDARRHTVQILKRAEENLNVGGLSYTEAFNLAVNIEDPYIESGIFGASVGSQFAKAAGIFTLVPGHINQKNAGSILLGQQDWSSVCAQGAGPVYTRVNRQFGALHWLVDGGATLFGYHFPGIRWVVDTGATGLLIPPHVYSYLTTAIGAAGAYMQSQASASRNIVGNCIWTYTMFPIVRVHAGEFQIDLGPVDYLEYFDQGSGTCRLKIEHTSMQNLPNVGILGTAFLSKTVTIFDSVNDTVGFCPHRS